MLTTLRIRNLAVIEDLRVEFGSGFNVLTGETGAGKSIVVDALGLAAGDRGDATRVRSGAERAVVEAAFRMPSGSPLHDLLRARGIDADGDDLVVRREVAASGGGRAFVNGSPCPLSVLREAGDLLVEIHGQHEHQSLLRPERQQDLLDAFAEHGELLSSVAAAHEGVAEARERLSSLRESASRAGEQREEMERIVREIDAASPKPGEWDELERERRLLRNAGRVAGLLDEAVRDLYEAERSAVFLAAAAARRVAELAAIDPDLAGVASGVETARVDLQEAGATLRDYRERARFDPERLEAIEERKTLLERLRQRYARDEAGLALLREEAGAQLAALHGADVEIERAREAVRGAEDAYASSARALGISRAEAASRLSSAVEVQFRALALERGRLAVRIVPARGDEVAGGGGAPVPFSAGGAERAEFQFSANPGEDLRPLARVVSGGELSRVMLALHVALERDAPARVLVFDEVDAGIGGAVADAVGARLSRLGRRHQVLCVTHLPQVAAHADRHYHVSKRLVGGRATAEARPLAGGDRVEELARMLGGREVTAASRKNAADLIGAAATNGRARPRREA